LKQKNQEEHQNEQDEEERDETKEDHHDDNNEEYKYSDEMFNDSDQEVEADSSKMPNQAEPENQKVVVNKQHS